MHIFTHKYTIIMQKKEDRRTYELIRVWLWLYTWMVSVISFTAFYSPFIAGNYTWMIGINSLVLFISSAYLIGYVNMRTWLREKMKEAAMRAEIRARVKAEFEKQRDEKK